MPPLLAAGLEHADVGGLDVAVLHGLRLDRLEREEQVFAPAPRVVEALRPLALEQLREALARVVEQEREPPSEGEPRVELHDALAVELREHRGFVREALLVLSVEGDLEGEGLAAALDAKHLRGRAAAEELHHAQPVAEHVTGARVEGIGVGLRGLGFGAGDHVEKVRHEVVGAGDPLQRIGLGRQRDERVEGACSQKFEDVAALRGDAEVFARGAQREVPRAHEEGALGEGRAGGSPREHAVGEGAEREDVAGLARVARVLEHLGRAVHEVAIGAEGREVVRAAGDARVRGELKVEEPHRERTLLDGRRGITAASHEHRVGVEAPVEHALAMAEGERVADLLDELDAMRERQRGVATEKGLEVELVVVAVEEEARRITRPARDAGLEVEDVRVIAEGVEHLGLAERRANELLASLGRDRAGDGVDPHARGAVLHLLGVGLVVLPAASVVEEVAEGVARDGVALLGVSQPEVEERLHDALPARRVDDVGRHLRGGAGEHPFGERLDDVVARDHAEVGVAVRIDGGALVAEEHERLHVGSIGGAELSVEGAREHAGLGGGEPHGVLDPGGEASVLPLDAPVDGVALEVRGVALDLDEEDGLRRDDDGVDLVAPPVRGDEVLEREEVVGRAIGQRVDEELHRGALVGEVCRADLVAGLAECHRRLVPRADERVWRSPRGERAGGVCCNCAGGGRRCAQGPARDGSRIARRGALEGEQ